MKAHTLRAALALPALVAGAVGLTMWNNVHNVTLEASSHREAPMIADDPLADNTDLYAFRSPADPTKVAIIANYVPFELPHGGPNYSTFGEGIRYEIHVKNDGSTNADDITYRFTFTHTNEDPTTFFNIRLGAQNLKTTYTCEKSTNGGASFTTIVTNGVVPPNNIGPRSINGGAGLNSPQSYTDRRLAAVTNATGGGGEEIFCGPSDDPFFADLGAIFDLAGLRPLNATDGLSRKNCHSIALHIPINTLKKAGAPAAPANILDPNYVIGVWASASRQQQRTFDAMTGEGQSGTWVQVSRLGMPLTNEVINPIGAKDAWNAASPYAEAAVTEDYLSNPEVDLYMADNVPVAPQATKTVAATYYGEAVPALHALRIQTKSLAGFPGLPANGFDFRNGAAGLSGLAGSGAVAGTALAPIASGGYGEYLLAPGKPRSVDIKPIFHTGVPNVAPYQLATGKPVGSPLSAGKPFVNNFLLLTQGGPHGGDMLRLNMAVPVTPRNSADFSNQGLLAAAALGLVDPRFNGSAALQSIPNMDGFPNGRRLEDAVDQIELKAAGGLVLAAIGLWYDDYTTSSPSPVTSELGGVLAFTSGVERNDTTSRSGFPYVQTPWVGTGSASGPTNVLTYPDLTVSTEMPVDAGTYNNVTITSSGIASLNGPMKINGTLTVQSGGVLNTRGVLATNCIPITGSGRFILQDGATLRVCNPDGIASTGATGAIQLTGGRAFSVDATYEFNGGEAQTTGLGLPGTVRGIVVNNAAGVTLSKPLVVNQIVTLTNGNLNTSNANLLTLRSTPTAGTALVVNTNGIVSGPAVMERAIDPTFNGTSFNNGQGYRHYSSPVTSTTFTDLTSNYGQVFNQAYNTAAQATQVRPFPTVFAYDEARLATSPATDLSAFDKGFVVPASTDPMAVLTGYTVNIPSTVTVDLRGTLNTGPVSRTNLTRGASTDAGWQFLGNPYPSPIDFSQTAGVTRTNMDNAIYTYQSTGQYVGNYRTYNNGIGDPLLSAMQGFYTRVSAGQTTGSFALNNAIRVTSFAVTPSFNRGTADTRPLVKMGLRGSTGTLSDEAYVYFEQGASPAFEGYYDAYKLPNSSGMSVASIGAGTSMAINGLPLLTGATTVPLTVNVPAAGTYTLNAATLANFGAGTQVYLLDTQTGARIDLSQQPSYSFRATTTALPGRFSLYFGLTGPLAIRNTPLAEQVQLYPNPAHGSFTLLLPAEMGASPVTVKVVNQLGQLVSTRTVAMTAAGASAQFDASALAPGVYSLQLSNGANKVVKRVVVQ